jgi:DNA-directed RNA polymerase specialized sigma24 family protein
LPQPARRRRPGAARGRKWHPPRSQISRSAVVVHPWLFGIAHHVLLTSVRRGQVAADARGRVGMHERLELLDESYERVEALASLELDVDALVAGLPEEQRVALVARIVDEREYGDIAAELRCSQLVVRKRVSRALAALRGAVSLESKESPA